MTQRDAIIFTLIAIIMITGIITSLYIEPTSHFKAEEVPVLAVPEKPLCSGNHPVPMVARGLVDTGAYREQDLSESESFNILILGIDTWDTEESRSDLLMVLNISPKDRQVNVISIPRDTRVELPGVGKTKINHAHYLGMLESGNNAGTKAAVQAVSNLLACEINYYVKVNYSGFQRFVDHMGGVEITLPKPVKLTYDNRVLPAGKVQVDGELALKLVRERRSLPNGDFGRQTNQLLVLRALGQEITGNTSLAKLPELIEQVKGYAVDTNFSNGDLISLAWLFKDIGSENCTHQIIPGTAGYAMDPLINSKLYYWFPDEEKVRILLN